MSGDRDSGPGFKRLTPENWLRADPTGEAFVELHLATGEHRATTGDRWAERILDVHLSASVPAVVRDLWWVAQGALLYGWFFYPLYMLGDEQLHRVADAAILHRYQQLGGPVQGGSGDPPSFARRLRWLVDHGHIDPARERRWQAIRELRNLGSHADRQSLQMPIDALRSLTVLREEIDALFSNPAAASERHE